MTLRILSVSLSSLLAVGALAALGARAEAHERAAHAAPSDAAPHMRLAQREDRPGRERGERRERGGPPPGEGGGAPDGGGGGGGGGGEGAQEAPPDRGPPERTFNRERAQGEPRRRQQRDEAPPDQPREPRRDTVREAPPEAPPAQQVEQPRRQPPPGDMLRNQAEERMRQDAIRNNPAEYQKFKDQADTLAREKARQDAARQQQLDQRRARDDAARQKREADQKAREDAARARQAEEQKARDDAARSRRDADERGRRPEQRDPRERRDAQPAQRNDRAPPARFDRSGADREFERAREQARQPREQGGPGARRNGDGERWREDAAKRFEAVRKGRTEREQGSRRVIVEPDRRVIERQNDRAIIRHDESNRLQRVGREVKRERRKDGTMMIVTMGLAGALIYSLQDDEGRLLRRSRKGRDGREAVLIDNRHYYRDRRGSQFGPGRNYDTFVDLPPPVVRIPRDEYIVEYDRASPDDIYDALSAPPIEDLDRGYSLDEVRHSYRVLERMRRVDLDAINFAFGSWDVEESQYPKLERIARALQRIVDRSPQEVFLIEGHTDAVGSDIDNLSLSDRRAETVAVILTEEFGVPPENLTTQGYGEQYLKVLTEEPSRINRRVSVRRITPLLSREGWDDR